MEHHKLDYHIHKFFTNDFHELIVSDTFRGLGLTLISLFVPLFLLKQHITFPVVLIYYLLFTVLSVPMHFLSVRLTSMIGLKKTLLLSYLLSIIFYAQLYTYQFLIVHMSLYTYLFLLLCTHTISISLYWMAHHQFFINNTKEKKSGSSLGTLNAVLAIVSAITPLIGGFTIDTYGFHTIFAITILLLIIGSFFLFTTKEQYIPVKLQYKQVFKGTSRHRNRMYTLEGYILEGLGILWPLFLYFLGISLTTIGIIYVFSNLANAYMSWYAGKNVDKKHYHKLLTFGTIGQSLSIIGRIFAKTQFLLIGSQTLGGLTAPLWVIPVQSNFFAHAHKNPISGILNREIYMHIGRALGLIIPLCCLLFFTPATALFVGLIVAAICSFAIKYTVR